MPEKFSIEHYSPGLQPEWDAAVRSSRNATFLFRRAYMDYHASRFVDRSLLLRDASGSVCALFPASVADGVVTSHGGLTYGGLLTGFDSRSVDALPRLEAIADHYRREGYHRLVYKPVPYIYHRIPSDDDLYALWRMGATVTVRNISSAIDLASPLQSSRLSRRARKRAQRFEITVERTDRVADFWQIVIDNRLSHGRPLPAHTLQEMQLLHDRFPEHIPMFRIMQRGDIVGGAVVYLTDTVAHLQYAYFTPRGREIYAEDAFYRHFLDYEAEGLRFFDFGTNNEQQGRVLNPSLITHKEELGGRPVIYDTYTLDL